MDGRYKTYKIILTTIGPVFIGDGKSLHKKEYIRAQQFIRVPDMEKMYTDLWKMGLTEKYEKYMMSTQRDNLGQWLQRQKVKQETIDKWIRYQLQCDIEGCSINETQIMTFMKDPYGCPYIPGSSLKGALRTILMSYAMMTNSDDYNDMKESLHREIIHSNDGRTKYLIRQTRQLEVDTFHTLGRLKEKEKDRQNAVNDVMSQIIVSDSRPLDPSVLIFCQKLDVHKDGKIKPLPLGRECLPPGTQIEFDLTFTDQFPYTIDQIKEAVKKFATRYYNSFSKHFKDKVKEIRPPKVSYIWLGGGAGYVSKTVMYPLYGYQEGLENVAEIMLHTVKDKGHGHKNDVREGISPHVIKCTRYKGKLYEMGQCSVKFEEI